MELFAKSSAAPSGRRVKAVWCPVMDIDQPEHIAIGGEHANVHVYNLTKSGNPTLVNILSVRYGAVERRVIVFRLMRRRLQPSVGAMTDKS